MQAGENAQPLRHCQLARGTLGEEPAGRKGSGDGQIRGAVGQGHMKESLPGSRLRPDTQQGKQGMKPQSGPEGMHLTSVGAGPLNAQYGLLSLAWPPNYQSPGDARHCPGG